MLFNSLMVWSTCRHSLLRFNGISYGFDWKIFVYFNESDNAGICQATVCLVSCLLQWEFCHHLPHCKKLLWLVVLRRKDATQNWMHMAKLDHTLISSWYPASEVLYYFGKIDDTWSIHCPMLFTTFGFTSQSHDIFVISLYLFKYIILFNVTMSLHCRHLQNNRLTGTLDVLKDLPLRALYLYL